jgi:predicted Rossmann fold nucleotide-binding protein DprA/Smf involved in DNA uptake
MMNVIRLYKNNSNYPDVLNLYLNNTAPEVISAIGNPNILKTKRLGVLSSVRCPGAIIIKTYDLMRDLREKGVVVISGSHSPMERECLTILLRGTQPVIICPARSTEGLRLRGEYKQQLADGRLLMISPFGEKVGRATAETATIRN